KTNPKLPTGWWLWSASASDIRRGKPGLGSARLADQGLRLLLARLLGLELAVGDLEAGDRRDRALGDGFGFALPRSAAHSNALGRRWRGAIGADIRQRSCLARVSRLRST